MFCENKNIFPLSCMEIWLCFNVSKKSRNEKNKNILNIYEMNVF